jgi:hypothetical protein
MSSTSARTGSMGLPCSMLVKAHRDDVSGRYSAGEAAGEPVTAAAQHHVVGRVVVRRVVVAVVQLQRFDAAAVPAPAALCGGQPRAALLVAAATDTAGVRGPRLAGRAVGAGVERPAPADAGPAH